MDATTDITLIEEVEGALGRVTANSASDTIGFYEAAGWKATRLWGADGSWDSGSRCFSRLTKTETLSSRPGRFLVVSQNSSCRGIAILGCANLSASTTPLPQ